MTATGFLEQKPRSPTGFGVVLLLHGAAIAGVVMIKNPPFELPRTVTEAFNIPLDEPPPPAPPPPMPREATVLPAPNVPSPPTPIVTPPTPGPTIPPGPPTQSFDPTPATSVVGAGGAGTAVIPAIERPRPAPVRTEALFDSRGGEQQPPYPVAELRAEREGSVRVQVRIGADGRVKAISRVSATSEAFWRATERHALARWRFRPATEDGRPVESSKTLTVHFRLDGS